MSVPDFGTLCRRQKTLAVAISYKGPASPLNLLVDSSVTADGAYDARKCHDGIATCNAHAVIPPRKNAKMWKPDKPRARSCNEAVRSSKYLGRALWRNLTRYHLRSRIETKMHCVKLLGQRLMARDFDRQVAEIQIRAAILNGFTAPGIPRTVVVG